ncbi:hypothetical protein BJ878DRAFT_544257 [Calycina marina]|uniref:Fork-head domain-containing protein n=1 Tax=Calycina marina TaxID=1763456 RepID=A0A9P8CD75_9HELO|nr:hypothetical protein BJ878DRAFT_544257 [Calycina marina]
MTSPHAPTPEVITPPAGWRDTPELTAVTEQSIDGPFGNTEQNKATTNTSQLPAQAQHPAKFPDIPDECNRQTEPEVKAIQTPAKATGAGEEKEDENENGKRIIENEPEKPEITQRQNQDVPGDSTLQSVETGEELPQQSNEMRIENVSTIQPIADGHLYPDFHAITAPIEYGMPDNITNAVSDDAAVATMPPRVNHLSDSMEIYTSSIENAALLACMQSPADYLGIEMNTLGLDGSLDLPSTSADGLLALQVASTMSGGFQFDQAGLDPSPNITSGDTMVEDKHRVSAYAKLEFADGEFYMNTHQVYLGRDQAMMKAAIRREKEEEARQLQEEIQQLHTPARKKGSKYSRSAVSESGGILRDVGDAEYEEKMRRRRLKKMSKKSKSTGSSDRHWSRRNSTARPAELPILQPTRQESPAAAAAIPLDPATLRPSPHDCPLVAVHPPGGTSKEYKAISRSHILIRYSSTKHLFEAEILGRNGAFVDERFCIHHEVIELKSGSQMQLGGVVVRFILPDVAEGQIGAQQSMGYEESIMTDRYSEGGKEMSFDFGDTPRRSHREDSSDEVSDGLLVFNGFSDDDDQENEEIEPLGELVNEDDEDNGGEDFGGDEEDVHESGQSENEEIEPQLPRVKLSNELANAADPKVKPSKEKKRGPGRPPKNGIMSKREQQLAKKLALEEEKAKNTAASPSEIDPATGKKKVGRPRLQPGTDSPEGAPREKRKYTKRKPKEPKDPNIKGEGSGEEKPVKPKKEKKPKPERSPTPTFIESELTPEQLVKPQANYVTLIYDALTDSKTGQMSLPQLYRAIQRKYPYFVLKTSTSGWQSSVRHNLSQHAAFQKTERDGKGWMWAIVQGASIEKEKKRRATPPPQQYPQQIYPGQPQYGYQGYPPPPPGYYQPYPNATNGYQGQQGYMPPYANGPYGAPPNMNAHSHPPYIPPHMVAPAGGGGSYSSPYAPKQSPDAPPQNGSLPQPPLPPTPSMQQNNPQGLTTQSQANENTSNQQMSIAPDSGQSQPQANTSPMQHQAQTLQENQAYVPQQNAPPQYQSQYQSQQNASSMPPQSQQVPTGQQAIGGQYPMQNHTTQPYPAPQNYGVQNSVVQTPINQSAATPNGIAQDSSPQDTVSQNSIPQNAMPQQNTPQNALSQQSMPPQSIPQNNMPNNSTPQHQAPQHSTPQSYVPQNQVPQYAVPQNAMPQAPLPLNSMPQNSTSQSSVPQNLVPQNPISQHAAQPDFRQPNSAAQNVHQPQISHEGPPSGASQSGSNTQQINSIGQPYQQNHQVGPSSPQNSPSLTSQTPPVQPSHSFSGPESLSSADDPRVGFIDRFKPLMVESLRGKCDDPVAVVESAANRLLGRTTVSSVRDAYESKIFDIMRNALRTVPAFQHDVLPGTTSQPNEPGPQSQTSGYRSGMAESSFQQSFQHTPSEMLNQNGNRPASGQGNSHSNGAYTSMTLSTGTAQGQLNAQNYRNNASIPEGSATQNTVPEAAFNGQHSAGGNSVNQTMERSQGLPVSSEAPLSRTVSGSSQNAPITNAAPMVVPPEKLSSVPEPAAAVPMSGQGQKRSHPDTDGPHDREAKRVAIGDGLHSQPEAGNPMPQDPGNLEMPYPPVTMV